LANYRAIYSVGASIAKYLQNLYPDELKNNFPCTFRLVASSEVATEDVHGMDQTVSILLHRITFNDHFRAANRLQDSTTQKPTLYLDLHYMLTYWGSSAEAEQTILGWTMQQLESAPILDASVLSAQAQWDLTETVQVTPANLSLEDILRIWDALGPKYRLSVAYTARVVRIDRVAAPETPVVATRFGFEPQAAR